MQTGVYETELDKVALAVESTKLAKQMTVTEEGIGEDININLFCWKDTALASIIQLQNTHRMDKEERIDRLTKAACILRRGWGVSDFTFVAEGYCSMKPSDTKGSDLAKLFAEPNSPVKECLAFTHIAPDGAIFVSVPYSLSLGKKVNFGNPLWYSGVDAMRDLTYTAVLRASLKLDAIEIEETEVDKPSYYASLAQGITNEGFEVFYRDDL